jgi:coenzyme F420 hydrogenase subunit beta
MIQYYGLPKPISNRIKLVIGLFCGSNFFFEATRHILYELCGVEDVADVQKLEYRGGGWPGGLVVQSTSKGRQLVDRHLYAYHIQLTAYQRDRCNMCFDWSADLADIAMGSYWLPSAVPGEEKGRSVMIVRTNLGERLVQTAEEAGAVKTEPISASTVVASYGYEIKKHGHVNRLKWRQRFGWPTPNYHRRFSFAPIHKEIWLCPEKK